MDVVTVVLSIFSGAVVGFVLGVIGGGGSILALPLLVYLVGYEGDPHAAIGTSALAVAASALVNVIHHKRAGHVDLKLGLWFALPGVAGALLGARLGLATNGDRLLILFACLMLVVAWRMWTQRQPVDRPRGGHSQPFRRRIVVPLGFLVGALSGFFGIGGGFLIVPALLWGGGIGVKGAIGTSLVAVTLFGLTTAAGYGFAGKLDLPIAGLFILGGIVAGFAGTRLAHGSPTDRLRRVFAAALVLVAAYMLFRTLRA
ncbi:MAG: sulfite exporter TauE/SafE family protein [Candidatus Thermoplasmatota archaeon]